KMEILMQDGIFDGLTLESYKEAILAQWAMELHNRIIPNTMDLVRECKKRHMDNDCTDYDLLNWSKIQELRIYLGQDTIEKKSLLTRIKKALDEGQYQLASEMQKEMQDKVARLVDIYTEYKKNLFYSE
ncbi:MAG: glutamine synthetase, partial [Eubacteriales bacterium]|nr:glutamine synthetase [Eubacteriales bacterium]